MLLTFLCGSGGIVAGIDGEHVADIVVLTAEAGEELVVGRW